MRIPLVVCAALAVACVSVNKNVLTEKYANNPVPTGDVQVFFADDSIPEHERVAILYAETDRSVPEQKMIESFRKEAGKLGANAIIVNEIRDPSIAEGLADAIIAGMFGTQPPRQERTGQAFAIYCASLDPKHRQP